MKHCPRLAPIVQIALVCVAQAFAQNAATTVNVDANANRRPINPNIYGISYGDADDVTRLNAPLNRIGGNGTTRYNWQIDAHSAGADWFFETYSDGNGTAGQSMDNRVNATRTNPGAEPMITIPMIDWLAKLGSGRSTLAGFSVKKYGAQQQTDPWNSDAGNGKYPSGSMITGNDPTDTGTANSAAIQQAWVQHFVNTFGPSTNANGIKYYILDNEPSLWYSTHRDVHPTPPGYEELYNKIVQYATAIRAADPNAKIAGFEEWGWWATYFSGRDQADDSHPDYNKYSMYYYPWLLQQLKNHKETTGTALIDILTVHCYNDGPGDGDDLSTQLARNKQTRILWDPSFNDPYWYGDLGINGRVINWIPALKQMVNDYYPGLPIGCTEYNWGDEANMNGATTQADVLGIYGREGFDLATRWTVAKDTDQSPTLYHPTYFASQIYRNYDGNKSTFGDVSVSAAVANPDNLSAFAAQRASDNALTVMVINKQQGSTPVTINVANFTNPGNASVWQLGPASPRAIVHQADVPVAANVITTTVPSQSITLFVIPSGNATTAPAAPTGLTAAVGNGTVTISWAGSGGATSYKVKRGTTAGGPYTDIATVPVPGNLSYTDSGLTNGTTYYYVVSASNSIGASPNSAEVSATPTSAPPSFTSSATASPASLAQGGTTSITATVKCTANSLSNATVLVTAIDPNGATAGSQSFTAQNFSTNQSLAYSLSLVPIVAGTYTVRVQVASSSGQAWHTNNSAGTITVTAAQNAATTTANPSSVAIGSTTTFTLRATSANALTDAHVQILISNTSGNLFMYNFTQTFTVGQTVTLSTTWTPGSSVPPGTYKIQVGFFDAGWTTNTYWNSDTGSVVVTATATKPNAPTGVTATAGNGQITVGWGAVSNATSYNVYRGTTAGGEAATAIATGITGTSYVNTGLANGTAYYYKVAAVNGAGTSALSAEVSATPQVSAPAAPANLTATRGNAQVTLNWTASSGATSYNVYRGTTAGGEAATAIGTGITGTSYTNTGLTNGTAYYYKVAAVNAGGTSALSNEATATPQVSAPAAPANLTATRGNAQVTLNWTASSGATSYNVYRGTTAGGEAATAIATGITGTTYTNTGLTNGTAYYYKVAAVNAGGISALSNEATATPAAPAGAVDVTARVRISVSGYVLNPFTNIAQLTVTLTNASQQAIAGPVELVLGNLPPTVTLLNGSGVINGNPYITLPGVTTLAPGQSASVRLRFSDPTRVRVTFKPAVYSGSL